MPPPRLPWKSPEWDDLATALEQAQLATAELSLLADSHIERFGNDAAATFLVIHHCISCKVVDSGLLPLLQLNTLFARKCVDSYQSLRDKRSSSPQWNFAGLKYRREASSVATLFAFALAHIQDDLHSALVDLTSEQDLSHSDYESVFELILECLGQHGYGGQAENAKDFLLRLFSQFFPGPANEFIHDLRAAVWITSHETVAARRMRQHPTRRREFTSWLARAYWEAEHRSDNENWFRAEAYLDYWC